MQSALNHRLSRLPGGRYGGVFLMGMVSALIVGPCVAAPLAGVLLFISQTGDLLLGGTALFAMAWGEGLLLLAVGATSGWLLPKAGPWMNGVRSEEHTSELQSLMRTSYAVFCLIKKNHNPHDN